MSDSESLTGLEAIADRALRFQRYTFRRAWGFYYAIWAVAIAIYFIAGRLPSILEQGPIAEIALTVLYAGTTAFFGYATIRIFRNAVRTLRLRRVLDAGQWVALRRRLRLFLLAWVALYGGIWIAFSFFPVNALTLLYASFSAVELFIYVQLRFSFSKHIPVEGKAALASYAFTIGLSVFATLAPFSPYLIPVAWTSTIVAWLSSAIYALRRASDELVEFTGS